MKKIVVVVLLLAFTITTACGQSNQSLNYDLASLQTYYNALEEITTDSDLIVEVELTGKSEDINYKDADFKVTEAQVKKVLKGSEELTSQAIRILEVAVFNMNQQNEHKKRLLFLEKYEGPVTQNAYVVAGVYQGNFKIDKDDKLIYDADKYGGYKSFQAELEKTSLLLAEEKVKQALKNPKPVDKSYLKPKNEAERIKAEEESRKQLEKDRGLEQ